MNYQLIVGNVGTLYYTNKREALKNFREYKKLSLKKYGRVAGETVTLFHSDEIIKEYIGVLNSTKASLLSETTLNILKKEFELNDDLSIEFEWTLHNQATLLFIIGELKKDIEERKLAIKELKALLG